MTKFFTRSVLFSLLCGIGHFSARTASAQCAQCTGPNSSPCAWGPFASGGAAACAPLVNYNGCVVAGDCTKGGGGESPEGGDLLAAISLTPDGFLRRSTRTARLPLLNLARGLSVARTCGGLLVTAVFTEKEAFAALLASDALTI